MGTNFTAAAPAAARCTRATPGSLPILRLFDHGQICALPQASYPNQHLKQFRHAFAAVQ
jgi:hypothetical protein